MSASKIFLILGIFLLIGGGIVGAFFLLSGPGESSGNIMGVVKPGKLLTPPRNYCSQGYYIESLDGNPIYENETALLLGSGGAKPVYSELVSGINNVVTVTGNVSKGKDCLEQTSCNCDSSIKLESYVIDSPKTLEYVSSMSYFEGTTQCVDFEGECVPTLITPGGSVYQLFNPSTTLDDYTNVNGRKLRVWANLSTVENQIGETITFGTLYVGRVQEIQ